MSEKESDADRRPEGDDPLEEGTQPMPGRSAAPGPDAPAEEAGAGLDTTTWSHVQAPPALFEEQETVIARPPEPEPASEVQGDDAGAEAAVSSPSPEPTPRAAIAPSSSLQPMLLERVEPSLGRGERIRLDAAHWHLSLGRADHNDVRLYTASASREHAVIAGTESGEWVLTPAEGRSVMIDGDATREPVVLEVGMNLVMGSDHLRCVTEGLARTQMGAQTSSGLLQDESPSLFARLRGASPGGWLIGVATLLVLAVIAFAWVGR